MPTELELQNYRIKELERKVLGMQRQINIVHAISDVREKRTNSRIRNLEIKTAIQQGVPQNVIANIYELSPGRISQIAKKIA